MYPLLQLTQIKGFVLSRIEHLYDTELEMHVVPSAEGLYGLTQSWHLAVSLLKTVTQLLILAKTHRVRSLVGRYPESQILHFDVLLVYTIEQFEITFGMHDSLLSVITKLERQLPQRSPVESKTRQLSTSELTQFKES
jgi:hypothetical protein